ncbi:MAG: chloride channel protein [Caldilineaceae bacterium]
MAQERTSTRESSSGRGLGGRLRAQFNRFLDRRTIPEELIIVGTALLVGIGTGLGAVIFIHLLEFIAMLTERLTASIGMVVGTLLAMGLAGAAVGLIIDKFASEAKGHGVPEVMEAVAIKGGRIRARVAAAKVLASSLTIGTGGSAGREGPIVQVGAALGSSLGQFLRFSDERVNTLVACGAAAGIAATFNAPIAGTIFAMEVILGSFTLRYFGAVVISSVAASVISRMMLSERPAFLVPAYPLSHLAEIPIYVLLGLLAALVAVAFIQTLYYLEGRFDNWQVPVPVRTTVGMLAAGVIALAIPGNEVLGPGLHFIGENIAVNVDQAIGMLAILLVGKLLATSFTLGSGNSGGVFAPSLFMGALLGGIVGTIANQLWPNVAVNPGAYAIVGMAALFAGAARAPITAVLIVFEMSNDYKLILPVMLATVLSTIVAELLFPESIYTLKLACKGISLERARHRRAGKRHRLRSHDARCADRAHGRHPARPFGSLPGHPQPRLPHPERRRQPVGHHHGDRLRPGRDAGNAAPHHRVRDRRAARSVDHRDGQRDRGRRVGAHGGAASDACPWSTTRIPTGFWASSNGTTSSAPTTLRWRAGRGCNIGPSACASATSTAPNSWRSGWKRATAPWATPCRRWRGNCPVTASSSPFAVVAAC